MHAAFSTGSPAPALLPLLGAFTTSEGSSAASGTASFSSATAAGSAVSASCETCYVSSKKEEGRVV